MKPRDFMQALRVPFRGKEGGLLWAGDRDSGGRHRCKPLFLSLFVYVSVCLFPDV